MFVRNDYTSESLVPPRQMHLDESSSDARTGAHVILWTSPSPHRSLTEGRIGPGFEETRRTSAYHYYKIATLLRFSSTDHGLDGSGVDVHEAWPLNMRNCTSLTIFLTNKSPPYFVR